MVDVAILGAAGYAGAELTRLVLGHPRMRLVAVTSSQDAGRKVSDVYPALAGCELTYVAHEAAEFASAQLAFLTVPHTAAMAVAPGLLDAGVTVVDASADFRLKDAAAYEEWYGVPHTAAHLLADAVYGLPELGGRDALAGARLVACPGCYPTAALLAIAPALAAGIASPDGIVIDAKSGVSGAGRTPSTTTHFVSANEALNPYKVAEHRHTPEIEQELARVAGAPVTVTFVPHLVPMTRGMLVTAYLRAGVGAHGAAQVYADAYAGEPFVTVHPDGRMPSTAEVRGSNRAHLGVKLDERSGVLVVACAIDNLVKGTSGQAVQCANLALGMDETAGLDHSVPVV
ncbi:MAG: N-acetyl-gamma-glutamyl-phosphate reductase [Actinobacteria bacterium]|nr:MAG: N-acetyl-gamma-glutamyl-phosphate reductase [Actinomycetota bacterium]